MDIERMPSEYVIKAEKEKEKRRRERKREEQQAMQEKMQEERNKRAIERCVVSFMFQPSIALIPLLFLFISFAPIPCPPTPILPRSMQAPKKRTGRMVMYRSRPSRTEEKKGGDEGEDKDNTDEIKYLS